MPEDWEDFKTSGSFINLHSVGMQTRRQNATSAARIRSIGHPDYIYTVHIFILNRTYFSAVTKCLLIKKYL